MCYATNDNQSAVIGLLETTADLAIVMGGKNSSNSSHLVELCEQKLPTYFIDDASKIIEQRSNSKNQIGRIKSQLLYLIILPNKEDHLNFNDKWC